MSTTQQDWERLVTEGHVIGHRLQRAGGYMIAVAFAFLTFAGLIFYLSVWKREITFNQVGSPYVRSLYKAFPLDPDTYVDLGNGETLPYRFDFLKSIPPQQGLSAADQVAMVRAIQADLSRYGNTVDAWTATPALDSQPFVTRANKVFGDHQGKLAGGIVAIPEDRTVSPALVSWTTGRLSIVVVTARACFVALGLPVDGCTPIARDRRLNVFIPAAKAGA